MANALYSLAWALVLLFLAWPLGLFFASWYIFIEPFEGLFFVVFKTDVVYTVNDFLERVVLWPRLLGRAVVESSPTFPIPPDQVSAKERISASGFECSKIIWSIAWLLLLIFVAWPIAYFLSWWWIIIMPFESLIPALVEVDSVLEAFVMWPRTLMKATLAQCEEFPSPFVKSDATPWEYQAQAEEQPQGHTTV